MIFLRIRAVLISPLVAAQIVDCP